eukprot:m.79546 g.79546  ORF g.79546 m.79546 type:complete len:243 (-) comp16275_c0_seq2:226-954(-)
MLASIAAVSTSVVGESWRSSHPIVGNSVKDCLEPIVNQVSAYLADVAVFATEWTFVDHAPNVSARDTDDGAGPAEAYKSELWYRAPDFERFKNDVVAEARSAGFDCPHKQYDHIRRKYLDEVTIRNTAMNLHRASSGSSDGCSDLAEDLQTLDDIVEPRNSHREKNRRGRHRRSVSFDLNNLKKGSNSAVLLSTQPLASPIELPRSLSADDVNTAPISKSVADEVGKILSSEDDPELAAIFL